MGTLRDLPTNPAYAATNFRTNVNLLERTIEGPLAELEARLAFFERRPTANPFDREHMECLRTVTGALRLAMGEVHRARARGDLLQRHQQRREVGPTGGGEQAPKRDGSVDHGSSGLGDAA